MFRERERERHIVVHIVRVLFVIFRTRRETGGLFVSFLAYLFVLLILRAASATLLRIRLTVQLTFGENMNTLK